MGMCVSVCVRMFFSRIRVFVLWTCGFGPSTPVYRGPKCTGGAQVRIFLMCSPEPRLLCPWDRRRLDIFHSDAKYCMVLERDLLSSAGPGKLFFSLKGWRQFQVPMGGL